MPPPPPETHTHTHAHMINWIAVAQEALDQLAREAKQVVKPRCFDQQQNPGVPLIRVMFPD